MTSAPFSVWFWSAEGTMEISESLSYSQGTQRENDYRSRTVKSGLTGYREITNLNWSWAWSGNLGGGLGQNFYLRNSSNTTVYSTGGGGSSGSKSFSITGLDPNQTYNIFMTANSNGGSYMERNAYGSINYTAIVNA